MRLSRAKIAGASKTTARAIPRTDRTTASTKPTILQQTNSKSATTGYI